VETEPLRAKNYVLLGIRNERHIRLDVGALDYRQNSIITDVGALFQRNDIWVITFHKSGF
jgi:hypothetical protein